MLSFCISLDIVSSHTLNCYQGKNSAILCLYCGSFKCEIILYVSTISIKKRTVKLGLIVICDFWKIYIYIILYFLRSCCRLHISNHKSSYAFSCVRTCVSVCVVCACGCVHACVRACVRACACLSSPPSHLLESTTCMHCLRAGILSIMAEDMIWRRRIVE